MRPDLLTDLYHKESTYWWNVSKRGMVLSLLRSSGFLENRGELGLAIDIGCGGGYTARVLESDWRMVGIDISRDSLQLCQSRGLKRLCRVDVREFSLPFKTDSFDLVLALDVVEHVEDDIHALSECHRILKVGGLLIVTVPAFMALWSPWDEALGHRRRYTVLRLAETSQQAGLAVKKLTYMFFFLFPIAVLIRGAKRLVQRDVKSYSSDFIPIPAALNSLLIQIGRLEQWMISKLNFFFPFGLSVISVMTKEKPSRGYC
jgi:SAM-dependent methyltransferase